MCFLRRNSFIVWVLILWAGSMLLLPVQRATEIGYCWFHNIYIYIYEQWLLVDLQARVSGSILDEATGGAAYTLSNQMCLVILLTILLSDSAISNTRSSS